MSKHQKSENSKQPLDTAQGKKQGKLEKDLAALTADLQRVQADFVNYKRRQEEERAQIMEIAKHEVIKQLLPIFDNIDRALVHVPKDLTGNEWAKGVAQVAKQAEDVLAEFGVEKIKAKGQAFDPQLHEAVSAEGEGDNEVVAEELQTGYKIGDYVIRPSVVKVGRK